MRISHITIKNFRNFADLSVSLATHAVIVGENKIGKSNLLYALRLLLDPSLPDSARTLREEDFWDGLQRPLDRDMRILIAVDLTDFEHDENQLSVLAEHLVEPSPMVSRLTYVWQPLAGLTGQPKKDSDYEFFIYGGDRPENRVGYEVRRRLPLELLPALRDCEGDLARWSRSPLRPLLDKAAATVTHENLEKLALGIDVATDEIAKVDEVRNVAASIAGKLLEMVGSAQAIETLLRFSPTDPDKLIRTLRIFIDGGKRSISEASLGSANLLYLALKALEYDQLVVDGDRDHTFLAIEEPEAHLHPNLQRLIFRNYLRPRQDDGRKNNESSTILMTTHSPHIASVTPLRNFVVLRKNIIGNATEAVSTANLSLTGKDVADLERYLDVNRGEFFFARGIVLVEGDAERYLLPVLARQQGYDLDELGISVCSVSGTNFAPYLILLGNKGLNIPLAALTDYDPLPPKADGTPRNPLGPNRIVNSMLRCLVDKKTWVDSEFEQLFELAGSHGIFTNSHTFEVDLFLSGLQEAFSQTISSIDSSPSARERMIKWAADPASLDASVFIKDIEQIGKGRFAQRLASTIIESELLGCPDYILSGIKYVVDRC